MTDIRDKIAAVLADHLTDDYVAGKCACGEKTDDGHSTHQADAVIRELTPILLDFGEWLAEEVGFRLTPVDLQSCLEDWRGD